MAVSKGTIAEYKLLFASLSIKSQLPSFAASDGEVTLLFCAVKLFCKNAPPAYGSTSFLKRAELKKTD